MRTPEFKNAGMAFLMIAAVATMAAGVAGRAAAEIVAFDAVLTGAQEVPPVTTSADGQASVFYDTVSGTLYWTIFHDLANATQAHFHGSANSFPGTNAGIQVDIGQISGLGSPMIGSRILTPQQSADLLAGRWYINIHTSANSDGEVRGQVAARDDAGVVIFPPSGPVALTQGLNVGIRVDLPTGVAITSGTVTLNGQLITTAFIGCLRFGTPAAGGRLLLCSIPGNTLAVGDNFFSIVLNRSDGASVGGAALWQVFANTEP